MTGYLYIATPYSKFPAGKTAAYYVALRAQQALVLAGIPVFVPIVHTHKSDGALPVVVDWLAQDFPLLAKATALVVLEAEGWDTSEGIAEERAFAKANGIPEYHLTYEDLRPDVRAYLVKWGKCVLNYPQHDAAVAGKHLSEEQTHSSDAKRVFATGASRDTDAGKLDYEGFLSPLVLERFAVYMHANRKMRDGSLRDSDNWQKGIPQSAYMKSAWRHFFSWWQCYRDPEAGHDVESAICGAMFNAMGYLHETLKAKSQGLRVAPLEQRADAGHPPTG